MRLTETIKKWLTENGMSEQPEINDDVSGSSTHIKYRVGDFIVPLFMDADEEKELFQIYAYFGEPMIPQKRIDESKRFIHELNSGIVRLGVFQLADEDRSLRYYNAIDVEKASFETAHIANMVSAGLDYMEYVLPKHMAICFSEVTIEEVFSAGSNQNNGLDYKVRIH